MQKEVKEFANIMQGKLDKNKHKECDTLNQDGKGRTWKDCEPSWLLYRLRQEALELELSLNNESPVEEVAKECADVANFAMMIADVVGGLNLTTADYVQGLKPH